LDALAFVGGVVGVLEELVVPDGGIGRGGCHQFWGIIGECLLDRAGRAKGGVPLVCGRIRGGALGAALCPGVVGV
jgi:hypothetical protein